MANIKTVLNAQLGNHKSKGPSGPGDASSGYCSSATMCQNSNTQGNPSGEKQGTLAAAARVGTNGYKK
jgi:hypothetical protein